MSKPPVRGLIFWCMAGHAQRIGSGVRGQLAQHFRLDLVDLPGHGFSPAVSPVHWQTGLKILLMSDLRKKLRNVKQPAILIHGENDVINHPDAAKWMNQQFEKFRTGYVASMRSCTISALS